MYCILVAGMPASGKSTIAKYLAEKLEIPMISKDNLKEIMFDEIGFGSREEKNKLGRASMKIMYHIAEQMMTTNTAFILENNFEDISKGELMQLLDKYGYTAITVRLTGDYQKIYERFAARDKSPERHRGHVVNDCYPEVGDVNRAEAKMLDLNGFLYGIEHRGYERFVANGPCIVMDMTDISRVDRDSILEQVKAAIVGSNRSCIL